MRKYEKTIQEVLEYLIYVSNEDEYDWDVAGIVYELEEHIDDALKLSEVQMNPETKNLLVIVKNSINEIDSLLDDYGDDSTFKWLESRGVFDKKKFRNNLSLAVKSLVTIAGVKKNDISDEELEDLR